ncbi:MAG: DMT family transporter [Cyanobium sp.]
MKPGAAGEAEGAGQTGTKARSNRGPIASHSAPSPQGWGHRHGATLAMVAAAFSFSLMSVCVKQLHGRLPVAEVVLGRAVLSVLLSAWLVRRSGVSPWGQRQGLLALRGLIGTAALFAVYEALMRLPLAAATVIQYLYPSVTTLLAWRLLGERANRLLGLALLLGWLGVVLVARPPGSWGEAGLPAAGLAAALIGALLTSLAYVSVRELARSEHPQVIVLWFPLLSIPVSLPLVLQAPVLPTAAELGWLVGVGLFTQLGQIGLTHGLVRLPAARATTVSYVQVGFAALWGWLLFGERLQPSLLAGAALILASVLLSQVPIAGPKAAA